MRPTTEISDARRNIAPDRCPLCGAPNGCQRCTSAAYKGPCWCESVVFPEGLLERVPPEAKNRACICRDCVTAFLREKEAQTPRALAAGDFYLDRQGRMVFTERYLSRRGYCCGNGCRHCPYPTA